MARGVTRALYVAMLDTLTNGERLAQTIHATAELHAQHPGTVDRWRATDGRVVAVVADARTLGSLAVMPGAAGFREPDRGDELTAVAVVPEIVETWRILRRLPLAS